MSRKTIIDIVDNYVETELHSNYDNPDKIEVYGNNLALEQVKKDFKEYISIFNPFKDVSDVTTKNMVYNNSGVQYIFKLDNKLGDGTLVFKKPESDNHKLYHGYGEVELDL